jgi:hypothetical protein
MPYKFGIECFLGQYSLYEGCQINRCPYKIIICNRIWLITSCRHSIFLLLTFKTILYESKNAVPNQFSAGCGH